MSGKKCFTASSQWPVCIGGNLQWQRRSVDQPYSVRTANNCHTFEIRTRMFRPPNPYRFTFPLFLQRKAVHPRPLQLTLTAKQVIVFAGYLETPPLALQTD